MQNKDALAGRGQSPHPRSDDARVVDLLIIDDDTDIRDVLASVLRKAGYSADTAPNGKVAIDELNRREYRLVLTDIFMPDADGLEVLQAARAARVPVISMSGSLNFDPELFQRVVTHLGAHRTLTKPFTAQEALAAVKAEIGLPVATD